MIKNALLSQTLHDITSSRKRVMQHVWGHIIFGPQHEKTLGFANNKGPDKPAHLCSLISDFVICLLESIMSKLATSKISIF